jgi:diacylglycerol kinase (ATP)
MRVPLVVNTSSGSGPDPDRLAQAIRDRGHTVEVLDVADAAGAAEGEPGLIVVAGGDGSLGPAADAAARCGAALGVIPAGTANDFAAALGLPDDEDEALALALDPAARRVTVDLARADARPFLNAANFGLAADAAQAADDLKDTLGPGAYVAGALKAGITGEPFDAVVTVDDQMLWSGPAWQVLVAGTGAFGAGSGLDAAVRDDGLLDVAVIPGGSRPGLVRRALALRRGDLAEQSDVPHARGRLVTIDAPQAAANIDGEIVDPAPRRLTTGEDRVLVVAP